MQSIRDFFKETPRGLDPTMLHGASEAAIYDALYVLPDVMDGSDYLQILAVKPLFDDDEIISFFVARLAAKEVALETFIHFGMHQ